MALPRLLQIPRFVRFGVRVDTAPEWLWLALLATALWPTLWWMGQRMLDGSDDPLGLLALAALGVLVWQQRQWLRPAPRLRWLALALAGAVAATVLRASLPPLAGALIALLALAAGLVAFLPPRVATAPVLGLSVLSLPLLASLQFYAGYPLRVLTAEASRWLLALQHDVARSGSSLLVDGQLIIVDAPCSGVQMVWLGYFTACVVALHGGAGQRHAHSRRLGGRAFCAGQGGAHTVGGGHGAGRSAAQTPNNRRFLTRLPAVSVLVLTGNVLRNTVLVAAQAADWQLPAWAHDAVGLVVLAAVCGGIGWVMGRDGEQHAYV